MMAAATAVEVKDQQFVDGVLERYERFLEQRATLLELCKNPPPDLEEVRRRYYELEGMKRDLCRTIFEWRRDKDWRQKAAWASEDEVTRPIYCRIERELLGAIKAYSKFLREHQAEMFPIPEGFKREPSAYELLLWRFQTDPKRTIRELEQKHCGSG